MVETSGNQIFHSISSEHPSLPGHFPGNPIVPGVVILNVVFASLQRDYPSWEIVGIRKLKFLQPLSGQQQFTLHYGEIKGNRLRFKCLLAVNDSPLIEGHLKLRKTGH